MQCINYRAHDNAQCSYVVTCLVVECLRHASHPSVRDKHPEVWVSQQILLRDPCLYHHVGREVLYLAVPFPHEGQLRQRPEHLQHHIQLLRWHLAGGDGGAEGDEDGATSSRVQPAGEVPSQRLGLLHSEAANLYDVGEVRPGAVGHWVAVREEDGEPSLHHLLSGRQLVAELPTPDLVQFVHEDPDPGVAHQVQQVVADSLEEGHRLYVLVHQHRLHTAGRFQQSVLF